MTNAVLTLIVLNMFVNYHQMLDSEVDKSFSKIINKRNTSHHQMYPHNTTTEIFSKWTSWSRCIDCLERRLKTCINYYQCGEQKLYQERTCKRKKCKRKVRRKTNFHVVNLYKDKHHLTRQAPSKIWSKWSNWSPCDSSCRTQRIRVCRKPGRCHKQKQSQSAFCYHDQSGCEMWVQQILGSQHNLYQKFYNANDKTVLNPKKPKNNRCGKVYRKSRMLRIIGGRDVPKAKWPWHVALLNHYGEAFCGGTLVSSRWVLTASHCIRPYIKVRLNEHNLLTIDGDELEMKVYRVFQHPQFNRKTVDSDIALLQLPYAVDVPVACLPTVTTRSAEMCSVMGWGKVRSNAVYGTSKLREAELPIVDTHTCRRSYKGFLITPNMLCAGLSSGKADTCAGDSGGGLLCKCPLRTNAKGKIVRGQCIQGITSFGEGCGKRNKYGIYTTVYNYVSWIKYIIDIYT